MIYDFVIKSKQIYVPPSKGRKGYYREDPREKHILDFLKGLLQKIISAKKKGILTDEQRKYIRKSLKEVEPRMKYVKTQKQRMAVAKVLKQIRIELVAKEDKRIIDKLWEGKYKQEWAKKQQQAESELKKVKSGSLSKDELQELKLRGFTPSEIDKLGVASAKAVIWNDISRDEALGKGLVTRTHAVRQRNTPIYHIVKPKVKMGEEEKKNKAVEKEESNVTISI